jgi:hypothetical protein
LDELDGIEVMPPRKDAGKYLPGKRFDGLDDFVKYCHRGGWSYSTMAKRAFHPGFVIGWPVNVVYMRIMDGSLVRAEDNS